MYGCVGVCKMKMQLFKKVRFCRMWLEAEMTFSFRFDWDELIDFLVWNVYTLYIINTPTYYTWNVDRNS
jgi:hypothetical protein